MLALLRLVSRRHLTRSPGRTLLTLAGVALGVAALVAIDVTNGSSTATIDELVRAYAGKAQFTVSAASGTLEPGALGVAAATPGVAAAAGSLQVVLLVGPDLRIALPAIAGTGDEDAIREYVLERGARPTEQEVLLGGEAARRLGVDIGGAVRALTPLGVRSLRVSGVLADRGVGRANGTFVAVLPYATTDVLYQREGRLDAIDVALAPGARANDVAARLRSALPAAEVRTPEARGGQTKKLVASLQSLLQVISALSLFIGTFLVFNTMSIAVAQRKREFGILRALGVRQREVVALVTLEATFIGLAASAAGAAVGVLMAQAFLGAVNTQIRANFVAGLADQLVVPWPRLVGLVLIGVAAALVGALGPAVAAASAAPSEAMTVPRYAAVERPLRLRLLGFAAVLGLLCLVAVNAQSNAETAAPGSVAAFALMLAIAVAAAPLLALGVRAAAPLVEGVLGLAARLARESVLRSPGRAAVTAAALSAAITMVVGLASFIDSERTTIFGWLDQAVNADMFVSAGPVGSNSAPSPLDPSLAEQIRGIPGVRAVDLYRQVRIEVGTSFAALASVDVPTYLLRGRPQFAPGTRSADLTELVGRDLVFVSDNFANRIGIRQDDTLRLNTPDGPVDFRVSAIAVDYTSDQGLIFMDRTTYVRHFHDRSVDSFAVMLERPADLAPVRDAVGRLESGALFVQSNEEFKGSIRKIVNDFFSTTYVMEAIALLVGVLGVANTMLVAVLERRREIGVLRAVGATRRQIRGTVLIEAGTIGAFGAALGLAGGAGLAAIVFLISERTTGWVIPFAYAWTAAATVTVLSLAAALAAAWWPARRAARADVAGALMYE